jgi:hypothetical protein
LVFFFLSLHFFHVLFLASYSYYTYNGWA